MKYTRKQINEAIRYWKKQLNENFDEDFDNYPNFLPDLKTNINKKIKYIGIYAACDRKDIADSDQVIAVLPTEEYDAYTNQLLIEDRVDRNIRANYPSLFKFGDLELIRIVQLWTDEDERNNN